MTFNRYVAIRMVIELIGAVSCAFQLLRDDSVAALAMSGAIALVWIAGEVWVTLIFNRTNPRTDELSDQHQHAAFRFAFLTLVAVMSAVGFAAVLVSLYTRTYVQFRPMFLPTMAMLALAVADARYLWLERGGAGGDDED
ncbi:hypothetical protein [Bifidobacterium samirii]|uniref:Uncharacterized protein n=1 Tax=Bifidobacterium samirii TaxID=2306974 RepID=A0A430FVV4_9BIFI|nr:hypothetical protein [Bifidobacterium samirii]RSX58068.1 hypothetical protein D2E24_0428 [Bifidobacterium samirii]